jgi:hypothetical protein
MTVEELRVTLTGPSPPAGVDLLVKALWWDAKGDWSRAHEIAQDISSPAASWVHAYLTAKKAMHQTPAIGTDERESRMRGRRSRPSGPISSKRCSRSASRSCPRRSL